MATHIKSTESAQQPPQADDQITQRNPSVEISTVDDLSLFDELRIKVFDRSLWASLSISLLVHAVLLLIMAMIIIRSPLIDQIMTVLSTEKSERWEPLDTISDLEMPQIDAPDVDPLISTETGMDEPVEIPLTNPLWNVEEALLDNLDLADIPQINLSSHFGGRQVESRESLLKLFGGSLESERAVERGLRWLAQRQRDDGSWSFNHRRPSDRHSNHQAGHLNNNCLTGATGLALMAFLGAGHTQMKDGKYQDVVRKGVHFLLQNGVLTREGIDLRGRLNGDRDKIPEGNYPMYAHALATIALCENYGMTRDRLVRQTAQGALDFIVQTRDQAGGGWRYEPEEPGDLSVTGWMIMALKSGQTARLKVNSLSLDGANQFLEATQKNGGATYAYLPRQGPKPSTSAIGLLCRMYLGWTAKHPPLQDGARRLGNEGPSQENIYFNYYATQVLHHLGGDLWQNWNEEMRDWLVETQLKSGPEAGSWNVTDPHGNAGGRLYQPA